MIGPRAEQVFELLGSGLISKDEAIDFLTMPRVWSKITKEKKCDCGAEKVKTTHAHWCSTK